MTDLIGEHQRPAPRLNPMPGRIVVELVDRMTKFPPESKWSKIVHRSDLNIGEMDQRYQHQPFCGKIVAFGKAQDDDEATLLAEAKERTANGELFIFTWGAGTDYSSPQMMMLEGKNEESRFGWLAKLRTFRIKDLATSISGGDELGGSDA